MTQCDRHDALDPFDPHAGQCAKDARRLVWLAAGSTAGGTAAAALYLHSALPASTLLAWLGAGLAVAAAQWRSQRTFDSLPHPGEHPCARAHRFIYANAIGAGVYWGVSSALLAASGTTATGTQLELMTAVAAILLMPMFALAPASLPMFATPALLPMAFASLYPPTPPQTTMGSLFAPMLLAGALAVAARATHSLLAADVRQRRRLYHQATHDPLVGLANRTEFERRAQLADAAASQAHAVLCLDIDHFKQINDTAGHAIGDDLLREIGSILRQSIRKGDTAARLGGDEFAILMRDCSERDALRLAGMLLERIADVRLASGAGTQRVTASLGIAVDNGTVSSSKHLLEAADRACYEAKRAGRNRIAVASTLEPSVTEAGCEARPVLASQP